MTVLAKANRPLTLTACDKLLTACAYQMRNAKDPVTYDSARRAADGWLDARLKLTGHQHPHADF